MMIPTSIIGLFDTRSPLAIGLPSVLKAFLAVPTRIIAVVVDAVKGQPCGAFAHIGEKMFKMMPSLTHPYTPASVVRIPRGTDVVATIVHTRPRSVQRMFRQTVRAIQSASCALLPTATALGMTITQMITSNWHNISAGTLAPPFILARVSHYDQIPRDGVGQVYKAWIRGMWGEGNKTFVSQYCSVPYMCHSFILSHRGGRS